MRGGSPSLKISRQHKEVTDLRQSNPEVALSPLPRQRMALNRLDQAFRACFRRVKRGEKPGFPRFKGRHRAGRSFDIPTPSLKHVNKRDVLTVKGLAKASASSAFGVRSWRVSSRPESW